MHQQKAEIQTHSRAKYTSHKNGATRAILAFISSALNVQSVLEPFQPGQHRLTILRFLPAPASSRNLSPGLYGTDNAWRFTSALSSASVHADQPDRRSRPDWRVLRAAVLAQADIYSLFSRRSCLCGGLSSYCLSARCARQQAEAATGDVHMLLGYTALSDRRIQVVCQYKWNLLCLVLSPCAQAKTKFRPTRPQLCSRATALQAALHALHKHMNFIVRQAGLGM